jgi:prevent-host-death family protein
MDELVSAADANRKFSQLLQNVRRGRSYIVTIHGKPVAKISPIGEVREIEDRARANLLFRLHRQSVTKTVRWTREDLYQDLQQ